jgi:hypothetical protein
VVATLVSNDDLPGHLDWWFPVVPVEGVEDVLILCLNPAPLNTQGCAAKYPILCVFRLAA